MSNLLETKSLNIGYGDKLILENFNISIKKNEAIGLMGTNGSGKTSLLKTLSGLIKPLSGEILFDKEDISKKNHKDQAREISIVLTDRPALLKLSVYEILLMGRYPYNEKPDDSKKHVLRAAELLNITKLINQEYSNLSDGQKQVVLICRALVQDTHFIILDEPFTYLDIPKRLEVMSLFIKIIQETNKTLLFSSHDLDIVTALNVKVLLIESKNSYYFDEIKNLKKNGIINKVFGHPEFSMDLKSGNFIQN